MLLRRGDAAEAEQYYREALRISPSYAEVHYNLSLALAAAGKQDEAKQHLDAAVRLNPGLAHGVASPPR